MEWWQAIVLGLVEGITEFLPVSSTGHLILASALLGLNRPEIKQAVDDFNIVAQGGAVLAVVLVYRERVSQLLRGVFAQDAVGRRLLINLVLAFLPAAAVGATVGDALQARLFSPGPVLGALVVGGVVMVVLPRLPKAPPRSLATLDARLALLLGLAQCLALWPGTSRAMTTIVAGLLLGLSAVEAAEFSFLLGIPTLGAACVYKLAKNLWHSHSAAEPNLFAQLGFGTTVLGIFVATAAAAVAVRWLIRFLNHHGLAVFGWYRIGLAALLGGFAALGVIAW